MSGAACSGLLHRLGILPTPNPQLFDMNSRFLCVVHDRVTKATLGEYVVSAEDWYYARHQAANLFQSTHKDVPANTWCVDSLELES